MSPLQRQGIAFVPPESTLNTTATTSNKPRRLLTEGLRVCHCNINSLRAHIESLRYFLSSQPIFHIIAVTETKLSPLVPDDIVSLANYTLLRCDRNVYGGGVALFFHKSLHVRELARSDGMYGGKPGKPEYLFCEIKATHSPPVFIAVVYRPPHAPFILGSEFVPQLLTHMHNYSHKVILGDFNADQLSESEDSIYIKQLMADNSLQLVNHGATHHTHSSDTWLDLIMVDESDEILTLWKTDTPFVDGHDLVAATIGISAGITPKATSFQYRDYKNIDLPRFLQFLNGCDWSIFDRPSTVDERVHDLSAHLTSALDCCAPLKQVTGGKHRCPWYTPDLRRLIRERDRLYKVYRRSRHETALLKYREARDLAHNSIEESRILFYSDRLSTIRNPQHLWKELRNLGLIPDTKSNCTQDIDVNTLNHYFSGVSTNPNAPSLEHYSSLSTDCHTKTGFNFREITLDDVHKSIAYFKTQARGVDGIPHFVVKSALPIIAPFILSIFNQSLSDGIFPGVWKKALVLAVNKTKSPRQPSDFRPIALLCFISKALERLVHIQLENHINTQDLYDEFQSGFRAAHSTQTALLKLTDDIRTGIDRRLVTILLLFDFSKAFDSVCHLKLLEKFGSLGFSPSVLKWLSSYLSGRKQAVIGTNGLISEWRDTNMGVPQGSVLGPLLFSVFIGDISSVLSHSSHLVYADDLQIYLQCSPHDLENGIYSMNIDVRGVSTWATNNLLHLNLMKTKAMIIGGTRFINTIDLAQLPAICLDGVVVPFVTSARNLGVIIDNKLNWKNHISSVVKSVNSIMYRLRFFRKTTSQELRKNLVTTLIFPHIDYCCLATGDLSAELDTKLQRLVNTGVRYVLGICGWEHITPHRLELGWVSTVGRRKYFAASLLYQILRSGRPNYLARFFHRYVTSRPVRGLVPDLVIPRFATETLRKSFHIDTTYFWNSLPLDIRTSSSLAIFKTALRSHILQLETSPA